MRTLLGRKARAVSQVFVLAGPLAGRIAACLPQSAVLEQQATRAIISIGADMADRPPEGPLSYSNLSAGSGDAWRRFARQSMSAASLIETAQAQNQKPLEQQAAYLIANNYLEQYQNQNQSLTSVQAQTPPATGRDLISTLTSLSSWELLLVLLLISLILISIIGNCLVCIAIFTDRRLRKLGNAFIVSLAIADLFVSCLVMTFALANDLMDYWMFGAPFCDIWISFDIMCCTASILNLCAISLDRFIHIKDCLLYNQLMTRRVAISAVIGIWIISALVSFVPINLGWHKPNHFKSAPSSSSMPALSSSSGGHLAGEPPWQLISALNDNEPSGRAQAFETGGEQAASLAPGRRARSRRHAFLEVASSSSEKTQADDWQHFPSGAQAWPHEAPRRRSVNKDFVPTNGSGGSSGLNAGGFNALAVQVDLALAARTKRRPEQRRPNAPEEQAQQGQQSANYNSDKLASGQRRAPATRLDGRAGYQVEFNPQDGRRRQRQREIKERPQTRVKRRARETKSSSDEVAQTSFGAAAAAEATALLDHGGVSGKPAAVASDQEHSSPLVADGRRARFAGGLHHNHEQPSSNEDAASAAAAAGPLPQCMLTLTPTYAIISSTISFYIPCLIMLGLYSKLFACARRHVRNIRAITRSPHPISSGPTAAAAAAAATSAIGAGPTTATNSGQLASSATCDNNNTNNQAACGRQSSQLRTASSSWDEDGLRRTSSTTSSGLPRRPLASRARTWLKFDARRRRRDPPAAAATPPEVVPGAADAAGCRASRLPNDCANKQPASQTTGSCLEGELEQFLRPLAGPKSVVATAIDGGGGSNATGGANDETIGCPAAPPEVGREDEPFLVRGAAANERPRVPSATTKSNNCDNDLQDAASEPSPGAQSQAAADSKQQQQSKFVTNYSATTIKLSLAPAAQATRVSPNAQINNQNSNNNNNTPNSNLQKQQTSQLATHKAAITLGIIMGSFLFCWVPFFCLNIIKAFYADSIPGSMFRAFTWLGYANSALNPIIYGIHNTEFRNAFNRIFFKHLTLKNGRQYLNRRFSHDLRGHHNGSAGHHHLAAHSNRRHHQTHGGGGGGLGAGTQNALTPSSGTQTSGNYQRGATKLITAPPAPPNNCQASGAGQIKAAVSGGNLQQTHFTPQRSLTTIHQTSEET